MEILKSVHSSFSNYKVYIIEIYHQIHIKLILYCEDFKLNLKLLTMLYPNLFQVIRYHFYFMTFQLMIDLI